LLDSTSSHDEVDQRRQSSPRRRRRTYADEALKENHHRLCDLIPKAWWTILLFLLLVPGGMLFVILQGYQHFHQQDDAVAATFALTGSGNLASWFASLLLLSAVVGSLQVYLLRRHKLDDYRGRYRIWLVVAAWSAIASLDASSGLHRLLDLVARRLPSSGMLASADGWWLLIASGLTGVLGLRLLVEMRRTLASVVFMSVALIGYGSLLARQLGWVALPGTIDSTLLGAMILLGSHMAVCLSIWVFARACFFSAQQFGRHRRHDSAHSQAGPHRAGNSRGQMAEDQAEEREEQESWVKDEEEEEEEEDSLYVSAQHEEAQHEEAQHEEAQHEEDQDEEDQDEEDQDEQEDEDAGSYWGQSAYDDSHQEEDEGYDDYASGLTSEEERLIAEADEEVRSQDPEADEMQADDEQYGERMDPERWRKMSKRQRKKWRRKQRRAA
jgi:hypothetical protein